MISTSEDLFRVCDALGDAYRAGATLTPEMLAPLAATVREAAVSVRIMEEALNERVAESRAIQPALVWRVIEGGRTNA